jgi:UDP-glucose 4-epimerase
MTLRETAFHWLRGETARVQTPPYTRDNIHASPLAKAYPGFVGANPLPGSARRLNPTGYPESQGAFAERVRREAAARLGLPCRVELHIQTEFPEPAVRINTDHVNPERLQWSDKAGWDQLVEYYAENTLAPSGALL